MTYKTRDKLKMFIFWFFYYFAVIGFVGWMFTILLVPFLVVYYFVSVIL